MLGHKHTFTTAYYYLYASQNPIALVDTFETAHNQHALKE